MQEHLAESEFVARYPPVWRLAATLVAAGALVLLFFVFDSASLGWTVFYLVALVGVLLGSAAVLTYRLTLKDGTLPLRTAFGTELRRPCDEVLELVVIPGQNITIRFFDWSKASVWRKVKELILKQFDSSSYVFNIPHQTVDLRVAGEALIRSGPRDMRVTQLQ